MQLNFKRLLYSENGRLLMSILLGIGLASLFHKACTDKDCIVFDGPVISEVDGKTFQHGEKCYKYEAVTKPCDASKKSVHFSATRTENMSTVKLNHVLAPGEFR